MRAQAYEIEMPLLGGYEAGSHRVSNRRGLIVSISDGTHTGWGEFVELPGYSPETTETALAALRKAPVTHSNPMAIAARRTAELDLGAKQGGTPLATVLGASPGPIEVGAVVARFGDLPGTLGEANRRLTEGYRKLKIKIGPGFDVEPLKAIRREHPGVALAADANGAYLPGEVPSEIDAVGLLYLEQPFPADTAWGAFATLAADGATPICLDESLTGPPTLRAAIAGGACAVVNLKPARYGGLSTAVELHDIARAAGLNLVAGGMLETGIGRAATAAFARLPGFGFPADLSASDRYWQRDLTSPPWVLTDGALQVPDRPGIGVEVDEAYLADIAIATHPLPS